MYEAKFSKGELIRIAGRPLLEEFRKTWRYHHPLDFEQLSFADQVAEVSTIGYYHGGDVLYQLTGVSGTWHEHCLLPA